MIAFFKIATKSTITCRAFSVSSGSIRGQPDDLKGCLGIPCEAGLEKP